MKMFVFSVYDKAVGAFLQPFFVRSRGEAVRSFGDAVNDPKSQFYSHALDFHLVYHGMYDDFSGLFDCRDPERVVSAVECFAAVDGAADPK